MDKIERLKLDEFMPQVQQSHPIETPNRTSKVGLLSLPSELLDDIVACFDDSGDDRMCFVVDRRTNFSSSEDEPGIRNVYRLRLVCKVLCDAASRIFMPLLRIRLSETSLARAEEIIRHPRVSQSLRGVELILDYRADNIANDFGAFFALKIPDLNDLENALKGIKNGIYSHYKDEEAERIFNARMQNIKLRETSDNWDSFFYHDDSILEKWSTIYNAWLNEREQTEDLYNRDDPKPRILKEGFRRFRERHAEQHQLVTSGQFTSRVSAICSRLANFQVLIFSDKEHYKQVKHDEWIESEAGIMFSDDKMLAYLTTATSWSKTWEDHTNPAVHPHILASRLIWDIPAALYELGVKLPALNLQCFPVLGNYAKGAPDSKELQCPEEALAQVETFYFNLSEDMPESYRHPTWEDDWPDFLDHSQPHMLDFLARRITSPNMRRLKVMCYSKRSRYSVPNLSWSDANNNIPSVLGEINAAFKQRHSIHIAAPSHIATELLQRSQEIAQRKQDI